MYGKVVIVLIFFAEIVASQQSETARLGGDGVQSEEDNNDLQPEYATCAVLDQKIDSLEKELQLVVAALGSVKTEIGNIQKNISDVTENSKPRPPPSPNDDPLTKAGIPRNCQEVQRQGFNVSGIYQIQPQSSFEAFRVACDMQTRGGGWAYFLNRFDGSQEFYLGWKDYKQGFGNLVGEFWLGLERLHRLTKIELNELLVELVDWNGNKVYAHYSSFSIGSEEEGYPLNVLGGYSGDAGDSFGRQGGSKFTTQDRDHDFDEKVNCAAYFNGAWWYSYKSCMKAQLTGKYLEATVSDSDKYKIIYWDKYRGPTYSLKEARMMVRPRDATSSPINLNERRNL